MTLGSGADWVETPNFTEFAIKILFTLHCYESDNHRMTEAGKDL